MALNLTSADGDELHPRDSLYASHGDCAQSVRVACPIGLRGKDESWSERGSEKMLETAAAAAAAADHHDDDDGHDGRYDDGDDDENR